MQNFYAAGGSCNQPLAVFRSLLWIWLQVPFVSRYTTKYAGALFYFEAKQFNLILPLSETP